MTKKNTNKYGLSRYIPEDIKRQVRQNSKFGCVVPNCRNAFYEYEHLIPEFKDAKEHDPDKICLVCNNHNPRRTGKNGQENYSKEQLIHYYQLIKESKVVLDIKNRDFFYGFENDPKITIGDCSFLHVQSIINIDGKNVFSFQKNKDNDPFAPQITFSGLFQDSNGNVLFEIKENEWISPTYHWDVETKNGEFSIWDSSKKLVFKAVKIPGENTIQILELNIWFAPFKIAVKDGKFMVSRYSNDRKKAIHLYLAGSFEYGKCGIYLNSQDMISFPVWGGFEAIGGEGFKLNGNGIWLGKGVGIIRIANIEIEKTGEVPQVLIFKPHKKIVPPPCAHYFVKGILKVVEVQFPRWTEKEYFMNGQKLRNRPNSWGKINEQGEHLYYIGSNEPADLSQNPGFIGFYADGVLKMPWADKVFDVYVRDKDEQGREIQKRVKRSEVNGREILSEINPSTGKFWHPQQFAGCSPWKHKQ